MLSANRLKMSTSSLTQIVTDEKEKEASCEISGFSLIKKFFHENAKYVEKIKILNSCDWKTAKIMQMITPEVLQELDQWMNARGYVAYGWTGYDEEACDHYFHGQFSRWLVQEEKEAKDSQVKTIPNYSDYSGCRIQFIEHDKDHLLKTLASNAMGSRSRFGVANTTVTHDLDNDLLAGRKVVIYKTEKKIDRHHSQNVYYLYYPGYNSFKKKQVIKQLTLPQDITDHFKPEFFEECREFGTIAAGEPYISNSLINKLSDIIHANDGIVFFACWSGLYLSRLLSVYGGYIPPDETCTNVDQNAAMNRIYLAKSLLQSEYHVYLPNLDTENTGLANHLALHLRHLTTTQPNKLFALTAPERLLDKIDPGEETILFGASLPGNVISIPCCRQIANYAYHLAINPQSARSGYSDDIEKSLHASVNLISGELQQQAHNTYSLSVNGAQLTTFCYSGKFIFSLDLIKNLLWLPLSLSRDDLNTIDANGDSMLHYLLWAGETALIQKLITLGADITQQNFLTGETPLDVAQKTGADRAIIKILENSLTVKPGNNSQQFFSNV